MISSLGNYLQISAILFSILAVVSSLYRSATFFFYLSFLSTLLSFLLLVYGFIISDFSVQNVFLNSSTLKPLGFKIAASWASHEGSILLWLCLLQTIGVIYIALFNSRPTRVYHIIILALIQILFGSFIYFTSNPFDSLSFRPAQGLGLNPMLQDIALIIHPPILYLGYVCYVVPFTSACVILLTSSLDFVNLRAIKIFTNLGMLFSTLGIALGSWWAYRELGWGGFWFFDPVENISLLPWLSAIALHHSVLVTIKSRQMKNWTITLSIITFLLVVFGTFLVRSSVITSIHSFTSSPKRAVYMLAIFAIVAISSLVLLILKGQNIGTLLPTKLDKPRLIIWGSSFFLTSLVVLLCATIYPIVYSLLYQESITISERFFTNNFIIFIIPTLLLAGIAQTNNIRTKNLLNFLHKSKNLSRFLGETKPSTASSTIDDCSERRRVSSEQESPTRLIYARNLLILAFSLVITFTSSYQIQYGFISACTMTFSLFLIIQNCYYILAKSNFFREKLKTNRPLAKFAFARELAGVTKPRPAVDDDSATDSSLGALPKLPAEVELCKRSNIAMILGHLGFGLLVFTITVNSLLQSEVDFIGKVGDKVVSGNFEVTLRDIRVSSAQNYYRQIAEFWIQDKQNNITILKPENRLYIIEKQLSQESNIYSYLTYDLYAVLSKIDDDVIHAKIYYKPMMSFIWISIMLMAGGFLIGLLKK
ncbi:heme lyase CcmF/NrfE family subunit [Candidatus Tisiphia endosymbiont of Micropterix aruncella]|uniref:heme lyase CcmF/NrfE family subunit n=1 Tax=Candidatus Tisiphia endosymbiont of Micropterix aruncella TaxID=3066271 RepID=UPI003AA82EAA